MKILLAALVLLSGSIVEAADQPSITVSAKSEIQVAPDEVVLYLSAHTRDKHLSIAKRDNDEITTAVMKVFPRYSIPDEDVKVTDLQVDPDYGKYDNRSETPLAYEFVRSIRVRLTNFKHIEPLISDVIEAGLNDISRLHFRVSNQRKYQFEARKLAMTYAREKAVHLTELTNMKLGSPLRIEEGIESNWNAGGFGGAMVRQEQSQPLPDQKPAQPVESKLMLVKLQKDKGQEEKTIQILSSPGQITISAEVTVEFAMSSE
ncbi:SIMPL domain-containing protein [Gimesia algae]|uniref:26 kDa periplasmic immunogenic protein n=1 Tax=Gimesia algae TaxID=2527971 RepID=A0A517V7Y4_9PLAN|nr:SIMPL domain-containing protein [Gimesia algae]QDT89114.1 26 kDa periplasmic immunogenic protein precursor [Gimesia algae]